MPTWYQASTIRNYGGAAMTPQSMLAELNAFFTDCANEGASFRWQVASYSTTAPRSLVLKRKDNSAGRIMFFGDSATSPSSTAGFLPYSGLNATSALHVCYDPTATTDSPPASYLTGNPWSAANSRGRQLINGLDNSTGGGPFRLRAYCTDDGQLFVHACNVNVGHLFSLAVGPIFRAASGGSTTYEGLALQMGSFASSLASMLAPQGSSTRSFIPQDLSANGGSALVAGNSYASIYINSVWQQINRVTGCTLTLQTLVDTANRMHFVPILCQFTPDMSAQLPGIFKLKNMAMGPVRTRDTTLVDNVGATRGYYIGHHGTLGSDLTGFSLLNDDM